VIFLLFKNAAPKQHHDYYSTIAALKQQDFCITQVFFGFSQKRHIPFLPKATK